MAVPSTARGSYARTPARRQEILDAAFEVFSQNGYENGSIREIAERSGITHTAVLFHFKSKVELLAAVLEERDQRTRSRFALDTTTPLGQLLAFIELVRDNLADPGMIELYTVLSAEATSAGHPAHTYFLNRYAWIIERAQAALVAMKSDGILHDWVEPDYAARTLIALADGSQLRWLYERDSDHMLTDLRTFVQSLITVPVGEEPGPDAG